MMEWAETTARLLVQGIGIAVLIALAWLILILAVIAQWLRDRHHDVPCPKCGATNYSCDTLGCPMQKRKRGPRRMQPRCPNCDSAKVFGEPGHRVCTNCGAHQVNVDHL